MCVWMYFHRGNNCATYIYKFLSPIFNSFAKTVILKSGSQINSTSISFQIIRMQMLSQKAP